MKVIDLFAGAGGLSEGFRQSGYEIVAHVEVDSHACDTLRTREAFYYLKENNQYDTYERYLLEEITREELFAEIPNEILERVIEEEISNECLSSIFRQIDALLNGESLDMIIGGPPCQAYSTAGISRCPNRMENDPRNYFYLYYKEFLEKYQPKIFVFENVRGILTAKKGKIFEDLLSVMDEAGYKIDYRILNAKDFGVPQNRERVIIIGCRKEIQFEYPIFTQVDCSVIKDIFNDLPKVEPGKEVKGRNAYAKKSSTEMAKVLRNECEILTQHIARPHNERDLEVYHRVAHVWNTEQRNLKYNELPQELQSHKNTSTFLDRYKILKWEEPSHTIVAHIAKDGHYYIHPDIEQNRSITVREAARIQTFPDDFYFERSRTAAFTQIGNAVPPLMARVIAESLKPFTNY